MKRPAIAVTEFDGGTDEDFASVNHYVSQRIRVRRMMLGLTQIQLAELIGVTCQQAHKYEKGLNKISSGRLYQIAQALGVEIEYFFEGYDSNRYDRSAAPSTKRHRLLLELTRHFAAIRSQEHKEVVCHMARALSRED